MPMDVKDAVKAAKHWVLEVMDDERPVNVGLEEVDYNDEKRIWNITLGFSRAWNSPRGALASISGDVLQKRAYRTIIVDDRDGVVKGMRRKAVSED
jgi:hypothetical protein